MLLLGIVFQMQFVIFQKIVFLRSLFFAHVSAQPEQLEQGATNLEAN